MRLIKRIRDLIDGSLNDLLDGLEDPETMINQLIRDMEATIRDTRQHTLAALTQRNVVQHRLDKARRDVDRWQENAELAVDKQRDDLARRALLKKREAVAAVTSVEAQLAEAEAAIAELRQQLHLLEEKVQEARRRRDTILSRKRRVQTGGNDIIRGFERFAHYEDAIRRDIAAGAGDLELHEPDLEAEFEAIKRDRDLDAELKALKAKREEDEA